METETKTGLENPTYSSLTDNGKQPMPKNSNGTNNEKPKERKDKTLADLSAEPSIDDVAHDCDDNLQLINGRI